MHAVKAHMKPHHGDVLTPALYNCIPTVTYVLHHLQVHLTYWSSTSVLVSWATCDAQVTGSAPSPPPVNSNSVVIYGPAPGRYTQAAVGVSTSYVYDYGELEQDSYASPLLHHVLLSGLTPGAIVFYTLGVPVSMAAGSAVGPGPKEYNFTVSCTSTAMYRNSICSKQLCGTMLHHELECQTNVLRKVSAAATAAATAAAAAADGRTLLTLLVMI
jgi:hypothetical protein